MDQGTVREFLRPSEKDPTSSWRTGDVWLAGGTFLFSTPLPEIRRLVDLTSLGWPSLAVSPEGHNCNPVGIDTGNRRLHPLPHIPGELLLCGSDAPLPLREPKVRAGLYSGGDHGGSADGDLP